MISKQPIEKTDLYNKQKLQTEECTSGKEDYSFQISPPLQKSKINFAIPGD